MPPTLTPASDVATLSLFGYDPLKVYTGRAPLETAAMGIHLGPHDWAIRCNLVYVPDGHMRDFTAGHISSEDGKELIHALQKELGGKEVGGGVLEFHAGVQYRNILVWRGKSAPLRHLKGRRRSRRTTSPTSRSRTILPQGPGCDVLAAADGREPGDPRGPSGQPAADRGGEEAGHADLALGAGQGANGSNRSARPTASAGRSSRRSISFAASAS